MVGICLRIVIIAYSDHMQLKCNKHFSEVKRNMVSKHISSVMYYSFLFTFFLWNVSCSFYYLSSLMISQLTGFLFPPWLHTDCTTCSSASWKYTLWGPLNYFCSELTHKSIGLDLFLLSHDGLYHTVFPPRLPNVSVGLFFPHFLMDSLPP